MILNKRAREFYSLVISTDVPTEGWEASFDGGLTWLAGEINGDEVRWLVRGPLFDPVTAPAATATLIPSNVTTPLLRLVDNPEVVLERGPNIILVQ